MIDNSKYGLQGKFNTHPGKAKELANILIEASNLMKNVKGCHLYSVSLIRERDNEVWVYEIWETKEDHDNSLNYPGVKELIGQAMPLLADAAEKGQELIVVAGLDQ